MSKMHYIIITNFLAYFKDFFTEPAKMPAKSNVVSLEADRSF